MTHPLDAHFQRLRATGRRAFLPFVTAGDPDLDTTTQLVRAAAQRGAGPIEIGFPYSDPIADGSVIQASYTRALDKGLRLDAIFDCLGRLTAQGGLDSAPLVAMVSYSLMHRRGPATFLTQAQRAGLCGAIVPDLPLEESAMLAGLARERDFKLIQLVTPTTPRERAVRLAQASTGFLYCVSVTGITGERDRLPDELLEQLTWLRTQTDLPLCVGFGVSKPDHIRMLKPFVDGVIVGSAIVRRLEKPRPTADLVTEVGDYIGSLVQALND